MSYRLMISSREAPATGLRIWDAQFKPWKFIKNIQFNSDLNFEGKMASAVIDAIMSKKRFDTGIVWYVGL